MKPLDYLKQLAIEDNRKRHPDFPDSFRPTKKYKTSTANGLTKAVVDFLNFSGHFATRINNQGTWVSDKFKKGGGFYRPSTQVKGIADIDALIKGYKVAIEIKIGADRQSEAQKDYQSKIERAGGYYWIVKDFDQFYILYTNFVEKESNAKKIC
ncbi:MAG: VRR-NUC domain-containing protein [Candidatus Planktophila sp.]